MCFCIIFFLTSSCNVVKHLKSDEYLITKNTVLIDSQVVKNSAENNIILQKTNTGIATTLGIPLRLHIYNLARPNIDSILTHKVLNDSVKLARKIKLFSKKQVAKELQFRKNVNTWLQRVGEAPTILNTLKTKQSVNNLKSYYIQNGWFNVDVEYQINKNENKRAQVSYHITKRSPYILDSLSTLIYSAEINKLQPDFNTKTLLKKGQQFKSSTYSKERDRITSYLRNKGFFHFSKDYILFETDTIGTNKKVHTNLVINNRTIRTEDSTYTTGFIPYKVKAINVYTDETYDNQNLPITDSLNYNGLNIFSKKGLKYKPKTLANAIRLSKNKTYSDLDRRQTLSYLNDLQAFKYPNVAFVEHEKDSALTANIYLQPLKKYELTFNTDVSQSNIQTIGFSLGAGAKVRNIFKGAETLELSGIASVGASKDRADINDAFFDINEFGANLRLTIPRIFFPINTEKIIPKFMLPKTNINASITSQRNIGLDKQTFSSIIGYQWQPSNMVSNTFELLNLQFVNNLNTNNYFGVYTTSFDRLNTIAQNSNYISNTSTLSFPQEADTFITDVLAGNTNIEQQSEDFIAVSNINERRNRLTENNLILSASYDYKRNSRKDLFDNEFTIFKWRIEAAGNLLSGISKALNRPKIDGNYNFFDVTFSQYVKTEVDYVNYSSLGGKNVFAIRGYAGIAIPYGNSNSIPFVESFFGGGPNDNRAWTAFDLGPGSSASTNEFNEANLKIHLSAEQRFGLFGSLDGALFVDAGNIWNVLDNVDDNAATFTSLDSLQDIAIGSGFGLRYDFSFFVFRFDVGFKTYNPARALGNRWFNDYNFNKAVYNVGINYPF